ncbi:MAG: Rrf2 family transcriptional regulator [Phycisphaerales bacterium]|nr:MAG: Rrf2 family transcriptional regulator [Phycisphaerales bacterium]
MYGKQTECAIAVMSRLAEVWDGGQVRLTSSELAEARGLSKPIVAKVLSALSQAGLVVGAPGPGGGFSLAMEPREIPINDVFVIFERDNYRQDCPFGGGACGGDDPCPLHERMAAVLEAMDTLLHETTFDVFRTARRKNQVRSRSARKPRGSRKR